MSVEARRLQLADGIMPAFRLDLIAVPDEQGAHGAEYGVASARIMRLGHLEHEITQERGINLRHQGDLLAIAEVTEQAQFVLVEFKRPGA